MTGSCKNIIIDGKNGFKINLRDVYDLSEKLKLINNMSLDQMNKMKEFTHSYALQNFKSQTFEEKLINFHESEKEFHQSI